MDTADTAEPLESGPYKFTVIAALARWLYLFRAEEVQEDFLSVLRARAAALDATAEKT